MLFELLDRLNQHGCQAYFVGGCVRDLLLDVKTWDLDIATNASFESICTLFESEHFTFASEKLGAISFKKSGYHVTITKMRRESEYDQTRKPQHVVFTDFLEEDAKRRDFTCNAIYLDAQKQLYDPYQGMKAIEQSTLKIIGDPNIRFREDPVRLVRMARFSSKYQWTSLDSTPYIHYLKNIAKHYYTQELKGLLGCPHIQETALPIINMLFQTQIDTVHPLNACAPQDRFLWLISKSTCDAYALLIAFGYSKKQSTLWVKEMTK